MITADALPQLVGKTLVGADDHKIGTVTEAYADGESGTFAEVTVGRIGKHTHVVPLAEAELKADTIVVPYEKDVIKAAPVVGGPDGLSPTDETRLYAHYGVTSPTEGAS